MALIGNDRPPGKSNACLEGERGDRRPGGAEAGRIELGLGRKGRVNRPAVDEGIDVETFDEVRHVAVQLEIEVVAAIAGHRIRRIAAYGRRPADREELVAGQEFLAGVLPTAEKRDAPICLTRFSPCSLIGWLAKAPTNISSACTGWRKSWLAAARKRDFAIFASSADSF